MSRRSRKWPLFRRHARNYVWTPNRWPARYRARRLARGRNYQFAPD